jgi:ASC-1-like (ASCH) protein
MILHLTLHKKWFDEIKSGHKKIEYREIKPYWNRRLENRRYDYIKFRNGYQSTSPVMTVECYGIEKTNQYYEIHLGDVIA